MKRSGGMCNRMGYHDMGWMGATMTCMAGSTLCYMGISEILPSV